jgi:hypothetical protein
LKNGRAGSRGNHSGISEDRDERKGGSRAGSRGEFRADSKNGSRVESNDVIRDESRNEESERRGGELRVAEVRAEVILRARR